MLRSLPVCLAVFDFDGTLVDSQAGILRAMTEAFAVRGLPTPDGAAVRRVVGLKLDLAVAALLPEAEPDEILSVAAAYRAAFAELRRRGQLEEPLYPGAAAALAALAEQDMLLGIATGKSRRGLLHALERHGLREAFVTLQTADDGPSKPHPQLLRQAMDAVGARPQETVMVGDTTFDMEMAGHADVAAIGVAWGYHESAALTAAGAKRILSHYSELPPALAAIKEVPA